ncbi:UDP-N-acetylmuramate dehydrogenase [bacterium]|nr:UDP-N-acetylmuramate dehydrogenase [bacterium]
MGRWDAFSPILNLRIPGLRIQRDYDLTNRTSMRMQARAALFATVETPYALQLLMEKIRQAEVPAFLLGGGANTLFATSYFEGVVFTLGRGFANTSYLGGNFFRAGAATKLPSLIKSARDCNLMGLEFLTMVPGTVGGALAGNAGAGNWGLCDFVERVFLMTRNGFIACVERNQFRYSYRHSDLREAVILEADFRLEPFNRFEFERRKQEFADKKKNQPYNLPSCGCIFKNPKVEKGPPLYAGKLIEESELKGYAINSAEVNKGHANFMVNMGHSTGEDFLALIAFVQDRVHERFSVELELEVQVVGGPMNSVVLA